MGAAGLLPGYCNLQAAPSTSNPIFADIALDGGPDFRHLFVPPYDSNPNSYGYTFWKARVWAHDVNDPNDQSALQNRYQNNYTPVTLGNTTFGVLNECGWLIQQISAGNVAIINNAVLSTNRDHSHSIIIRDSSALDAGSHDGERSGWVVDWPNKRIKTLPLYRIMFDSFVTVQRAVSHLSIAMNVLLI